jgi:hypothetical protein
MSRSYKKYVKLGTCGGFGSDNSYFYRLRRRKISKQNRQILRNAVAHFDSKDVDEHIYDYRLPKRDDWREPTDGTRLYDKKDVERVLSDKSPYLSDAYKDWFRKKLLPKLKRKPKRRNK